MDALEVWANIEGILLAVAIVTIMVLAFALRESRQAIETLEAWIDQLERGE